ncbi:MAG: iron chaperone [Fluviicola sp.]|jgi:uncharacterized protein YdhG (YjbR/CyaY superfamily)
MSAIHPAVEAYISKFPEEIQQRLLAMRNLILENHPDATEGFAYAMPAYKLNKKPLVYFAAYDKHIGVYATPGAQSKMSEELKRYKQGKGSIQFPNDQEFPLELILRVIACRAQELKPQ